MRTAVALTVSLVNAAPPLISVTICVTSAAGFTSRATSRANEMEPRR